MARGGGGAEDGWRSPPGTHRSPTMHTTRSRSPFETTLQGVAGQLVERVAALPGNAGRTQLLRWLLAIGAIFVAWRMWRGLERKRVVSGKSVSVGVDIGGGRILKKKI